MEFVHISEMTMHFFSYFSLFCAYLCIFIAYFSIRMHIMHIPVLQVINTVPFGFHSGSASQFIACKHTHSRSSGNPRARTGPRALHLCLFTLVSNLAWDFPARVFLLGLSQSFGRSIFVFMKIRSIWFDLQLSTAVSLLTLLIFQEEDHVSAYNCKQ